MRVSLRAWADAGDGIKRMWYPGRNGLQRLSLESRSISVNGLTTDEYEIMLWTTLYDKGGVMIYEGDIVRGKANPSDTPRKSAVFWTDHGWQVNLKDKNRFLSELEVEVIGNIYENPDLLK